MREINSHHRPGCSQQRACTSSGPVGVCRGVVPSLFPGTPPFLSYPPEPSQAWGAGVGRRKQLLPTLPQSPFWVLLSRRQASVFACRPLLICLGGGTLLGPAVPCTHLFFLCSCLLPLCAHLQFCAHSPLGSPPRRRGEALSLPFLIEIAFHSSGSEAGWGLGRVFQGNPPLAADSTRSQA